MFEEWLLDIFGSMCIVSFCGSTSLKRLKQGNYYSKKPIIIGSIQKHANFFSVRNSKRNTFKI